MGPVMEVMGLRLGLGTLFIYRSVPVFGSMQTSCFVWKILLVILMCFSFYRLVRVARREVDKDLLAVVSRFLSI